MNSIIRLPSVYLLWNVKLVKKGDFSKSRPDRPIYQPHPLPDQWTRLGLLYPLT